MNSSANSFWFTRHSRSVIFLILTLALLGGYLAFTIPVSVFPSTNFPRILIGVKFLLLDAFLLEEFDGPLVIRFGQPVLCLVCGELALAQAQLTFIRPGIDFEEQPSLLDELVMKTLQTVLTAFQFLVVFAKSKQLQLP